MSELKVLHIGGDLAACHRYRAKDPFIAMYKAGIFTKFFNPVGKPVATHMRVPVGTNLILIQRLTHPQLVPFMKEVKERTGAKFVYEQDDNLKDLDPTNPAYGYFREKDVRAAIEETYKMSDAVIVSTDALKEQISQFYRNPIYVVPNLIDVTLFKPIPKDDPVIKQKNGRITIGWGGGDSHFKDIRIVWSTLRYFLEYYPQIDLHFAGYLPSFIDGIDMKRLHRTDWDTVQTYVRAIGSFDIALAPLYKSHFNNAKSDIKALESGAVKVPCISSNEEPYTRYLDNEIFPACKTDKDWFKWIKKFIESPKLREEYAQKQYDFVHKNRNLWLNVKDRIKIYEEISGADIEWDKLDFSVPEKEYTDWPEEDYEILDKSSPILEQK